tara:strand:+ start:104 stop:406 length:303 start_codon:yes stop_codon:yes gene_type:complete
MDPHKTYGQRKNLSFEGYKGVEILKNNSRYNVRKGDQLNIWTKKKADFEFSTLTLAMWTTRMDGKPFGRKQGMNSDNPEFFRYDCKRHDPNSLSPDTLVK